MATSTVKEEEDDDDNGDENDFQKQTFGLRPVISRTSSSRVSTICLSSTNYSILEKKCLDINRIQIGTIATNMVCDYLNIILIKKVQQLNKISIF